MVFSGQMPVVEVSGSPYECGFRYGTIASNLIVRNLANYLRLFEYHCGISRDEARAKAKTYLPAIEEFAPGIVEEMEGISDGSGLEFEDILILNTRTELLSTVPLAECTSLVILPAATVEHSLFLAQNWDWWEVGQGQSVLYRVEAHNEPLIATMVEAGQVGKMGMNECGLGLCVNWLESSCHTMGLPFIVVCRNFLRATTPASAISQLCGHKRGTAANYLVAHRDGFAINFETTPNDYDYIEPSDGFIAHTNHFISNKFRFLDHGLKNQGWDSLVRYQRVKELAKATIGAVTLDTLKAILSDRSCSPDSICLSPNVADPFLAQWSTLASIIMDLTNNHLYVSNGRPNRDSYAQLL